MTFDITLVLKAIIAIITLVLTRYVVPWLIENVNEKRRNELADLVETAVCAADRWLKSASGVEKKQYVVDFLAGQGLKVDTVDIHSDLNVMIEAAVEKLRIQQACYLVGETEGKGE